MNNCKTRNKEGCCKNLNKDSPERTKEIEGGKGKMNSRIALWTVVSVLFIAVLILTFKAGAAGSYGVVQAAGSSANMAGGMVGGC